MRVFRLLQIGDIHFSDEENFRNAVDALDVGFPERVTNSIGLAPLQAVFRRVAGIIERNPPDLIVFMGDFTTRGDHGVLARCVAYIKTLFPAGMPVPTMLLFGNHDIDRRQNPDDDGRFETINAIFAGSGFDEAGIVAPTDLSLAADDGTNVRVFGVNSCRGCGQMRLLSGLGAKHLGEAIRTALADGGADTDLDDIYEAIDTPSIDEDTLEALRLGIEAMNECSLAVVCAHHNLLPQATPRIAPYSELINGGSVRQVLMGLDRPIIYLHGHLHTTPIEVVRIPSRPKSAIISISAPLFRDGFNLVEIAFNADSVPLGCRVIPYQLAGSDAVAGPAQIVPAWSAGEGLKLASRRGRELMGKLSPDKTEYRADLEAALKWSEAELDDALRELEWLGVLHIFDGSRPSRHWRVARAI